MKIEGILETFARVGYGNLLPADDPGMRERMYFEGVEKFARALFSRTGAKKVLDYIPGLAINQREMSLDELAGVFVELGAVNGASHAESINQARAVVFKAVDKGVINYTGYRKLVFEPVRGDVKHYRVRRVRD